MPRVSVGTVIRAPIDEVFWLAQDYGRRRREWDVFVRDMRFLDGADGPGVGVRSWTRAYNGLEMVTEFVTFAPPRLAAVKMVKGPFFVKAFAGSWRFEPTPEGVRVEFTYHVATLPGLNTVSAWILRTDMTRRLRSLALAAATKHGDRPRGA
jgi:hypothetical protein